MGKLKGSLYDFSHIPLYLVIIYKKQTIHPTGDSYERKNKNRCPSFQRNHLYRTVHPAGNIIYCPSSDHVPAGQGHRRTHQRGRSILCTRRIYNIPDPQRPDC